MEQQQVEERRTLTPAWTFDSIEDTSAKGFWITGGLGSGKTTGGAAWFIDRWLLNRDSLFSWAVAPTYTKVEQILMPAIRQVLFEQYGLVEDVHYTVTKSPFWKLRLNGYKHELHLLSGDRPKNFVGSNIACWWITEPGLQTREVYEKCQARLRCPKAKVRQFLAEGTPEGMNWYADMADLQGHGYDRYDAGKKHRRFIVETTFNKHLMPSPEEYAQTQIRDVYAYDSAKVLSYEKGLFVPFTKGSAYWEFVASRNVTAPVAADPDGTLDFCCDFNVSPLAWTVAQERWRQRDYFSPRVRQIVALAESSGEARGTVEGVAEFAARFPVSKFGYTLIRVYGDRNGWSASHKIEGSDYQEIENVLRKLGYQRVEVHATKEANPRIKQRLEKVASLMAYEMFVVTSDCRRLISSFTKTCLEDGVWDIKKPDGEDWTHYGDSIGYYLYQRFKHVNITDPNAKPVLGGG